MPIWQKAWAAAKAKGDVLFRGKRINRDPSLDDNNNPSGFDRAGKVRLKSQMKRSTSSFTDNPKPVSLVKPAASQLVGETGRRSALPDKELGTVSSLSEPTFSVDQDSTSDFTAVVTIDDLGFSDGPKLSNNDIEGFKKVSSVVNEKTADMTRTIDQSLRRQYQLSRGDSDEKYFVPIDQIYQILSMERVRDYLEDLFPDESKPKINAMAEAICGSDAGGMRRILATLILIGESNSIAGLIRCGLHDDNLPLRIRTNRSRKVVLSPSRQRNDEYEDDEELVDDSEMDIVFSDWKGYKIRDFHRTQYTFTVPIFRMPSDRIHFYRINSDIVLPFVDKERRVEGRFGLVSKVKMHPAHVETNSEAKDMELFFAVKEFPWRYRDAFREELRNLERFSGPNRGHDHIIRLCAAFQHGETRSLIFPWADEDLAKFWSSKKASPDSKEDVEWFAHQSLGIASAVEKLHGRVSWGNLRNSDTDRMTRGRHGDIKPENILCFEDTTPRRPRLVISDFGAMHFFTDKTVKDIPLKDIRELSIAYRPPEMDIQTTISQKSDIWSLGCVFLEFISWLLLGTDARNDFAKARVGDGEPNYPIAVAFFQLASKAGDEDGQYLAKLKPSVHSWIRKLRSGCSEFIHDFLDLIQLEMLNPDPKLRPHSDDIATRLRYMVRRIEYDDNYAVWASRWTPRTTPQATTTGRLRQMTNMVDHESFTDKLLTDIYLDLKYKQTFFQMRNLRGNIDANIIRSAAAFGGERFLPADQIVTLVTKDVVAQELKLAGVEPTDGLVEFTLREARVVFLTLSHTMNLQAFKALQANNFTDDCLPVKTTPGLTNGGDFRWIVDRFVGASHQAGRSSPGRWDGFDDWSSLQVENFAESQWLFLAPVLGVSYHSRVLQANTPMPFLETSELSSTTHKVWVHPSHIETDVTLHRDGTVPVVAVRVSESHMSSEAQRELTSPQAENVLHHPRLLKAIARYERGTMQGIILPWAPGGNLRQCWARQFERGRPRSPQRLSLSSLILGQAKDLADALGTLEAAGRCHGNLKPENIVNFSVDTDHPNLVLTDIGRAASPQLDYATLTFSFSTVYHKAEHQANSFTISYRNAARYMPPEYHPKRSLSSSYDVWALGSILLEYIILGILGKDRFDTFNMWVVRFWDKEDGSYQLQAPVSAILDELTAETEMEPVLQELLKFIRTRMLVTSLTESATGSSEGQTRAYMSEVAEWMHHQHAKLAGEKGHGVNADPDTSTKPETKIAESTSKGLMMYSRNATAELQSLFNLIRRLVRPTVSPDRERIEWKCSCGMDMYGDFFKSSPAALERLSAQLKTINTNATLTTPVTTTRELPIRFLPSWFSLTSRYIRKNNPQNQGQAANPPTGATGLTTPGATQVSNTGVHSVASSQPHTTRSPVALSKRNIKQVTMAATNHVPTFLELCVNVDSHEIRLGEISLSSTNTDQSLFDAIWKRYCEIRGRGIRRLFVKPSDINFIRFGVFHRGAVGVYAKPDAIPPPDEVNKKAYHYFECPLEPLPPMPANVFLHYMRCAKHENWSEKHPGAHQENIFLQRLPKKMGASIWQQPTNSMTGSQTISYGWGVQIIEGPNKKIMSLLLILGTLFSFLVSVLFVVLAKSQEQGFGIGQWILAVLTEVLGLLYFHFSDS